MIPYATRINADKLKPVPWADHVLRGRNCAHGTRASCAAFDRAALNVLLNVFEANAPEKRGSRTRRKPNRARK